VTGNNLPLFDIQVENLKFSFDKN